MMYTAQEVARYVVNKCATEGHPISNLQLQKILYFLQVGSIRAGHGIAFGDEMEPGSFGLWYQMSTINMGGMVLCQLRIPTKMKYPFRRSEVLDPIIEEKRVLDAWDW